MLIANELTGGIYRGGGTMKDDMTMSQIGLKKHRQPTTEENSQCSDGLCIFTLKIWDYDGWLVKVAEARTEEEAASIFKSRYGWLHLKDIKNSITLGA
jgi:hypothetical protein